MSNILKIISNKTRQIYTSIHTRKTLLCVKIAKTKANILGSPVMKFYIEKRMIVFNISMIFVVIAYLHSYRTTNYNMQIIFLFVISLLSMFYEKKTNIIYKMFITCFIIFTLNMPLIDVVKGVKWWNNGYNLEYLNLSISILFASMLFIHLGRVLYCAYSNRILKILESIIISVRIKIKKTIKNDKIKQACSKILNLECKFKGHNSEKLKYTLILFLITYVFSLYMEIDKLLFMNGRLYEDFYKLYTISYSSIITIIGNLNIYFLIFTLAILPKKKTTYFILSLFVIKTIPMLVIGKRGPFMLSLVFSFVYFLIRNMNSEEIWFGKIEKALLFTGLPLIIVFMTLINYTRSGFQTHGINFYEYTVDFFYRQGFTFKVHTLGIENFSKIQELGVNKNYLFGEIVDVIQYGKLGQFIFGNSALPITNGIEMVSRSNSYAHALAFTTHPKYLEGHGYGSSYILEAFQTYGILGLMIVNIYIGAILKGLNDAIRANYWIRVIALLVIEKIFFLSRAPFSSILSFVFKPSFVLALVVQIFVFKLITGGKLK